MRSGPEEAPGSDVARRSARRGWRVVAAAFVVMFATFGCAYSFSAFFSPLQASFGASRGALSWVLSIAISLFFIIGAFAVLVAGTAALFLDASPRQHGFLPDGGVASSETAPERAEGMALREAVRSRPFRLLYAAALCASLGLFLPFVHLAPFAEDRGIPHAVAVFLFTLVGLGSTFGRFLLGGVADRLGRRRAFAGMYLGMALMLVWWLGSWSAWQIAVFALVFGTCYGGFVALAPALIVDYFGERNAGGLIGISYTAVALGTLAGSPFAGYVFDFFRSYTMPIAVSAAAMFVSFVLICLAPEPAKP